MKSWMTTMAVLGAVCAMAGAVFLGVGDAAFLGRQNTDAAGAFLLASAILALGFIAWVPNRVVRIVAGLGLLGCAWAGLSLIAGFFLPAAMFTVIAAVLALCLKPVVSTQA